MNGINQSKTKPTDMSEEMQFYPNNYIFYRQNAKSLDENPNIIKV